MDAHSEQMTDPARSRHCSAAAPFRTVLDITGPLPGNLYGWFARALSVPSSRGFGGLADAR